MTSAAAPFRPASEIPQRPVLILRRPTLIALPFASLYSTSLFNSRRDPNFHCNDLSRSGICDSIDEGRNIEILIIRLLTKIYSRDINDNTSGTHIANCV